MKKIKKVMKLDAIMNRSSLTKSEMKSIKGGFACYCGSTYKGEYSSPSQCCSDCGISC
jgi:natural product precursor